MAASRSALWSSVMTGSGGLDAMARVGSRDRRDGSQTTRAKPSVASAEGSECARPPRLGGPLAHPSKKGICKTDHVKLHPYTD